MRGTRGEAVGERGTRGEAVGEKGAGKGRSGMA